MRGSSAKRTSSSSGEVDAVDIVYMRFISALNRKLVEERLLPVSAGEMARGAAGGAEEFLVALRIAFTEADGETLVGTTTGYQAGRPGFFLVPADDGSNIERCFVVTAATTEITFM